MDQQNQGKSIFYQKTITKILNLCINCFVWKSSNKNFLLKATYQSQTWMRTHLYLRSIRMVSTSNPFHYHWIRNHRFRTTDTIWLFNPTSFSICISKCIFFWLDIPCLPNMHLYYKVANYLHKKYYFGHIVHSFIKSLRNWMG